MNKGSKRYLVYLIPVGILLLSVLRVYPQFLGEYTQHLGSIECAYIFQAKFILENFPNLGWNPFWYGGHPFKLSYPPASLYLMDLIAVALKVSVERAYRILSGLALALLPLSIYWMTYTLSGSRRVAFFSSLMCLGLPSLHAALYTFPAVNPLPSYISVTAYYGETPHILGLTLAIITLTVYHKATTRRDKRWSVASILMIALVNLTNLIAAAALLIILIIYSAIIGWDAIKRLIAFYLFSFGLTIFHYDPEYVSALISYAHIQPNVIPSAPILIIAVLISLAATVISQDIYRRLGKPIIPLTLTLTIIFALITLSKRFLEVALIPQPVRYGPELDIFTYILVASTVITIPKNKNIRKLISIILFISITTLIILGLPATWNTLAPGDQVVKESPEYKVAEYLSTLTQDLFGPRVYATGSIAFWLNVFQPIPQVRGGFDQVPGTFNPIWSHITHLINTSPNTTLTLKWLKAYNIKYVVVDRPETPLPYKDYKHPEKFQKILKPIKEIAGITIYEVPLNNPSPIQLIELNQTIPIIDGILDEHDLNEYLKLIEQKGKNEATVNYKVHEYNLITVEIKNLNENHALLFKSSYDEKWYAQVNGKLLAAEMVGPRFMLFRLKEDREYITVRLTYSRGIEETIYDFASIAALCILVIYHLKPSRARVSSL